MTDQPNGPSNSAGDPALEERAHARSLVLQREVKKFHLTGKSHKVFSGLQAEMSRFMDNRKGRQAPNVLTHHSDFTDYTCHAEGEFADLYERSISPLLRHHLQA